MWIILASAGMVYLISLRNEFVWDDWVLMVYNDAYRSFSIGTIFFSKANALEYLPVRDITLAIDAQIWGMKPFGFHLTNLLLYLVSLIPMYRMVENLSRVLGEERENFIAFWSTLIFALHPLHTEVVNFIAARNNILAGLFLFISFNCCISGIYKKSTLSLYSSALFFVFSLFSKASVIFYPFFLVAIVLLIPKTTFSVRRKSLLLSLFFVLDALAIWIHFTMASVSNVVNENIFRYGGSNLKTLLSKALQITFFYIKKLIVPYPLSIEYPLSFESTGIALVMFLFFLFVLSLVLTVWCWKKGYRMLSVAVVWFFLSLVPALNIFPTSPIVADRYAYMAVLGFGIILASLLKVAETKKQVTVSLALGIIAVWASLCFARTLDWRSNVTLFESALSLNPEMDREALATALWNRGEYEKALAYLREDRERTGSYNYDLFLGRYLFLSGKYPEAVTAYQKALSEGAVALKEAHLYIAEAYEKTGSDMLALQHYLRVFSAKSQDPLNEYTKKAREGVDRVRYRLMPKLQELRQRVLNEPGNPRPHADLAEFLYQLGLYNESEELFRKSLGLDASAWDAWYNLGNLYMRMDKYEEAIRAFERSLALKPNNIGATGNIGICYAATHKYQKAAEYYERVLDLDRNNLYAAFNLGKIYFNSGDSEKAKKYLSMARSLAKGNHPLQTSIDQLLRKIEG